MKHNIKNKIELIKIFQIKQVKLIQEIETSIYQGQKYNAIFDS